MFLVFRLLVACGPSALPAGATCADADECDDGLACLAVSEFSGDTCNDVGTVCSLTCEDDDGCVDLGEGYLCFSTCDGGGTCGATGR